MVLAKVQGPAGPRRLDFIHFSLQVHHSAVLPETSKSTFLPQRKRQFSPWKAPSRRPPFVPSLLGGVAFHCAPLSRLPRSPLDTSARFYWKHLRTRSSLGTEIAVARLRPGVLLLQAALS